MQSAGNEPIRLAVITTSRSDFGSLEPVWRGARADCRFAAHLLICGQHLAAQTLPAEELGGAPAMRLPAAPEAIDGIAQRALVEALRARRIEVVFVGGDRYELLSVAECCTFAGAAIAHCSGGERTFGAFDDQLRDAVTKMAHLHFVAHREAAERVISMQEEPWRVTVSGDPGLDPIAHAPRLSPEELEPLLGVRPAKNDVVVALHPVTRSAEETEVLVRALVRFCQDFAGRIFLSTPNGDPGSEAIQQAWQSLAEQSPHCRLFPSLGAKVFRGLVAACGALVGNSSAGVWESPSLGTPSLDCGTRQSGRIRSTTVWSCGVDQAGALAAKVQHLLSPEVQAACRQTVNPYGDGNAVPRILDAIAKSARDTRLRIKL